MPPLSPQLSQAGDLIIEVYLEQKVSDCCVTLKVSPTMTAEELTNQVLEMRNVPASLDIWLTFEALENGELGEHGGMAQGVLLPWPGW